MNHRTHVGVWVPVLVGVCVFLLGHALVAVAAVQDPPVLVLGPRDYTATVDRVVDGDTVDLRVQAWPNLLIEDRFRLFGINAPEITGVEKPEGLKSLEWLKAKLAPHPTIVVRVQEKRDKYGRWLGVLLVPGEGGVLVDLNTQSVKEGFAKVANY